MFLPLGTGPTVLFMLKYVKFTLLVNVTELIPLIIAVVFSLTLLSASSVFFQHSVPAEFNPPSYKERVILKIAPAWVDSPVSPILSSPVLTVTYTQLPRMYTFLM